MKMTYSVSCETRANKRGERVVYLMVRRGGKLLKLNTGLRTSIPFTGREFPAQEKNGRYKTTRLNVLVSELELIDLQSPEMDNATLKAAFNAKVTGVDEDTSKCLVDYVRGFADLKMNKGTRTIYLSTAKKIEGFDSHANFSHITTGWLTRFYNSLLEAGMSINGAAIQMRNIRAVFNWAIDNEITEKYPFRKFKIPHERTRKRSLTAEQLVALRDYPVEKWQEEYRDMFMLSFYLIGINIGDMILLKKLTDGRCVYHRRKTGRLYDIAVQPEAMEIVNKYRGKGQLLSPLDRYKDYHDYLHHMNDALKKIGQSEIVPDKLGKLRKIEYEPMFPDLTSYWARHTWATIAARLDIPKETIGKALGHSDFDSSTTDIYIDFDMRKVDEANRKVLDFLKETGGR